MSDSEDPFLAVAHHEAGHAIAAISFGASVTSVWIADTWDPKGEMGKTSHDERIDTLLQWVAFYLAGLEAEVRINPAAVLTAGDKCGVDRLLEPYSDTERAKYLAEATSEAKRIVDQNLCRIEAIANELLKLRILPGNKVHGIVSAACSTRCTL